MGLGGLDSLMAMSAAYGSTVDYSYDDLADDATFERLLKQKQVEYAQNHKGEKRSKSLLSPKQKKVRAKSKRAKQARKKQRK